MRRPVTILVALALTASACASTTTDGAAGDAGSPADVAFEEWVIPEGEKAACVLSTDLPGGAVASADRQDVLLFPWEAPDDEVTAAEGFDPDEIRSGGPPPDGIRPLEHEELCFDTLEDGDRFLRPQAPVLAVEVAGQWRAYPLGIMTQHEIANDVVAGVPLVVTYCPLCNSGLAFERTVDDEVLTFGTSGRLFQSNLVMYDRQHRNLWSQFSGEAIVGRVDDDLTVTELVRLPTSLLGWSEFKAIAPGGIVLSPDVSPNRDYNRNPYPSYDDVGINFGLFSGPRDDALAPNTRVVGIGVDVDPVAIALDRLMHDKVVVADLDGTPVSVWWAPGASSALDSSDVDGGRDVGQTLSVVPIAPDGQTLTFSPTADDPTLFADTETGSTWNLAGLAVDGELAGTQLQVVPRDDTFWFVWFAFQPTTRVVDDV